LSAAMEGRRLGALLRERGPQDHVGGDGSGRRAGQAAGALPDAHPAGDRGAQPLRRDRRREALPREREARGGGRAPDHRGAPRGPMTLAAGTRLGPYEITTPLGVGGMGEVYRAKDTRLERSVALKVLPLELLRDADLRARFTREAK